MIAPPLAKTTNYDKNVKVEIGSLVVDTDATKPFDIYHFFNIQPPLSLISEWNPNKSVPFFCEVECMIISKERALTCPIILRSEQYKSELISLPSLSKNHQLPRNRHIFEWNRVLEFPIFYSELPNDSVLTFIFSAKLFMSTPVIIGSTYIPLFTKRTPKFRHGPFTLVFDHTPMTKIEKHIRRLYLGKDKSYDFVDKTLFKVFSLLHPQDAETFYSSLLFPDGTPKLSRFSQFAKIVIPTPGTDPSTLIIHDSLVLPESKTSNSLNPAQRLYYNLAHSTGGFKGALPKDQSVIEMLNRIKALPPLAELQPYDKNFLYNNFRHCLTDAALMPALFRSVNWENEDECRDIVESLETHAPVDAEIALEFFTPRYNIRVVRQFAVRCVAAVPSEELLLYLPQLLQATKAKYTEGLGDILVQRASDDEIFASSLYWIAQVEEEQNRALLEKLMRSLTEDVKTGMDAQVDLVRRLSEFLSNHTTKMRPSQIRDRMRELLKSHPVHSKLQNFAPVRLPLDPTKIIVGIDPVDVKVFKSKLCPVMLAFKLEGGGLYRVIFKIGDDMRQDQLILQLFEVMDHIFKGASMQLNITAYKTLAFSKTFGCCQFIENSRAILDIAQDGQTIRDFLAEDGQNLEHKIDLFTESLAAYSVMTYVLKIGDRHDNNILVTRDGRLLHIDYGFILGDVTKPFTPPLKLSREMIDTIGTNGMQRLCDWACPAFNSLRKKARLILTLIELMFTAPLECFAQNPRRRLQQVENCLLLKLTEIEASNSLQATFSESLNSKMQVFWDAVHVVAVSTNGASADK